MRESRVMNQSTKSVVQMLVWLLFHVSIYNNNMRGVHGLRPPQFGTGGGNRGPMNIPPSRAAAAAYDDSNHGYPQQNSYVDDPPPPGGDDYLESYPGEYHQSVEERLAQWREDQQKRFENQSPIDAANPRDEDGRMKLLASVSKGSISLFFFILMWRSVHHYEMADLAFKNMPTKRLFFVIPTVLLFLMNLAGCFSSVMSSSPSTKKKMKAILNLNKVNEGLLFGYNVFRLAVMPTKYTQREIYVGRIISNFLFLVQCQLFTKVTWGGTQKQSTYYTPDNQQYGGVNDGYQQDYEGVNQQYENSDTYQDQQNMKY